MATSSPAALHVGVKQDTEHDNAKDPRFTPPVDLPHVAPEEYGRDIDSGAGSAAPLHGGPPGYTIPGRPMSEETSTPVKRNSRARQQ